MMSTVSRMNKFWLRVFVTNKSENRRTNVKFREGSPQITKQIQAFLMMIVVVAVFSLTHKLINNRTLNLKLPINNLLTYAQNYYIPQSKYCTLAASRLHCHVNTSFASIATRCSRICYRLPTEPKDRYAAGT